MFSGVFQCKVQCISVEEGSRHEVSASVAAMAWWPQHAPAHGATPRPIDPNSPCSAVEERAALAGGSSSQQQRAAHSSCREPVTLSQLNAKRMHFSPSAICHVIHAGYLCQLSKFSLRLTEKTWPAANKNQR